MSQSSWVESLIPLQNLGTLLSPTRCLERSVGFLLHSQGLLPLCHASPIDWDQRSSKIWPTLSFQNYLLPSLWCGLCSSQPRLLAVPQTYSMLTSFAQLYSCHISIHFSIPVESKSASLVCREWMDFFSFYFKCHFLHEAVFYSASNSNLSRLKFGIWVPNSPKFPL